MLCNPRFFASALWCPVFSYWLKNTISGVIYPLTLKAICLQQMNETEKPVSMFQQLELCLISATLNQAL
jgi:hypothetical protein